MGAPLPAGVWQQEVLSILLAPLPIHPTRWRDEEAPRWDGLVTATHSPFSTRGPPPPWGFPPTQEGLPKGRGAARQPPASAGWFGAGKRRVTVPGRGVVPWAGWGLSPTAAGGRAPQTHHRLCFVPRSSPPATQFPLPALTHRTLLVAWDPETLFGVGGERTGCPDGGIARLGGGQEGALQGGSPGRLSGGSAASLYFGVQQGGT